MSDSAQASRPELIRSVVHRPAGEEVVALPVEGRLASFDRATAWLNSDPLTPAGLHGRVVVVDFWTYTCVNWLRTLPYLRAWAATAPPLTTGPLRLIIGDPMRVPSRQTHLRDQSV